MVNNKKGIKIKDPITYFSDEKIKDKFNDIDNLDEFPNELPNGQRYFVILYCEPDPSLGELWSTFTYEMFLVKSKNIIKKANESGDMNFLLKQYKSYKQLNFEFLRKEFNKKYGEEYDHRRILLVLGGYHSQKAAQMKIDKISSDIKRMGVSACIQDGGYWILYNPSEVECSDVKYANKKMNELMGGNLLHKTGMKSLYNERKHLLNQKYINDMNEKGYSAKVHKSEDSDGKILYKDDKDGKELSKKEIDEEFKLFSPENILELKHKEENAKHEKMLKDLVDIEMKMNGGEIVNTKILERINLEEESKKDYVDKIMKAKDKMKREISEKIKKN